tara:strand:+ start:442 stop:555 length:114 start_codon:yes stop_codon:yes gene_type:complete
MNNDFWKGRYSKIIKWLRNNHLEVSCDWWEYLQEEEE